MWLLLIFWWGPHAGVITKQETSSQAACERIAQDIGNEATGIDGDIRTMCIKVSN